MYSRIRSLRLDKGSYRSASQVIGFQLVMPCLRSATQQAGWLIYFTTRGHKRKPLSHYSVPKAHVLLSHVVSYMHEFKLEP